MSSMFSISVASVFGAKQLVLPVTVSHLNLPTCGQFTSPENLFGFLLHFGPKYPTYFSKFPSLCKENFFFQN